MAEINSGAAEKLWERYKRDGSVENKNELVMHYVYLVKSIVYRLMPTYEGYSNFDDLLSCGVLGLIDAINKYDISRDIRFESYAKLRIRGEIIDHMRRQDWAPSSLRRKIQAVGNAYASLEKELLREPTDGEVADFLGMEEKELQKILDKTHTFNVLHFEEMVAGEMSVAAVVPDTSETPEERLESKELKRVLGEMIEALPEKERLVITLYYYEEMTLKEIARVLGVSESRASQIHSKAMLKFRMKLQPTLGL
ncbi:MAG: FliA/WhiG family RNA polymerase sigma factor [Clostridiaceae bacterium]|nr:FliA/WhiG family RNA polymerase sigma factor [Eubacteriales bacterium]